MDLRASDSEREHTADALREAAGKGQLTTEELEERLAAAYGAVQRSELVTLTEDLTEARPEPRAGRLPVTGGEDGASWLISVMGGADRSGRWKLGRRVHVVNVMGGADLDLNDAELAADVVEMTVVSIWGGSDLYLPANLNVELSEFNLMAGNSIEIGDAVPDPGGPTLRLRMISIMAGNDVRRGRRKSWRERREERRAVKPPKPPHGLHRP